MLKSLYFVFSCMHKVHKHNKNTTFSDISHTYKFLPASTYVHKCTVVLPRKTMFCGYLYVYQEARRLYQLLIIGLYITQSQNSSSTCNMHLSKYRICMLCPKLCKSCISFYFSLRWYKKREECLFEIYISI